MRVYSYVMTLAKDPSLAEEIAQETFYRAFTADKQSFQGMSEELTWLCAIAKNLFFDEMRRQKRYAEPAQEESAGESIELSVIDKEMTFQIHCILHQLEEPYREVFELRVFGELSFRQIGTIFQKTESWARVTYHRARLKIQERMGKKNE